MSGLAGFDSAVLHSTDRTCRWFQRDPSGLRKVFAGVAGCGLSLLARLEYEPSGVLTAEGGGFEPPVRGYRTTVFKTVTFGRSVNLPLNPAKRGTS